MTQSPVKHDDLRQVVLAHTQYANLVSFLAVIPIACLGSTHEGFGSEELVNLPA